MNQNVLIVGGGIIGTYCAIQIARSDRDARVRILDRDPLAYDNASCGNMGGFAVCEVQPLATLHTLMRTPKLMLNPLSALTIRPTKIPTFSRWAFGFVKAALTPGHYEKVVRAQSTLMDRAYQAHLDVIGDTNLVKLLSDEGTICLYRKEQTLTNDWKTRWKLFRDRGEDCQILDKDELHARLPALDKQLEHAVYIPSIKYWKEPASLLEGLHDMARSLGIVIEQGDAQSIGFENNQPASVRTGDGVVHGFDRLVVTAGAWSEPLCEQLGDRVPLSTERGYSTTITTNADIKNLILFKDDEFVATPMNSGLRLGGTVELAGLEAPPNYKRTALLARQLGTYFPDIKTEQRTDWMGHRPSLPDTMPVIGQSPTHANVIYAFGHGHVGVTQSAITGKLVSQLIAGVEPEIDLKPFSIGRFSRKNSNK
jgi:D-amino-acid dehydrogenase